MNTETRQQLVRQLHERENQLCESKGREYTGGAELGNEIDTLSNFKSVAARTGQHPLQVWATYYLKHNDSIMTFIKDAANNDIRTLSEPITGRIDDARTYLGLLTCLLVDLGLVDKEEYQLYDYAHAAIND